MEDAFGFVDAGVLQPTAVQHALPALPPAAAVHDDEFPDTSHFDAGQPQYLPTRSVQPSALASAHSLLADVDVELRTAMLEAVLHGPGEDGESEPAAAASAAAAAAHVESSGAGRQGGAVTVTGPAVAVTLGTRAAPAEPAEPRDPALLHLSTGLSALILRGARTAPAAPSLASADRAATGGGAAGGSAGEAAPPPSATEPAAAADGAAAAAEAARSLQLHFAAFQHLFASTEGGEESGAAEGEETALPRGVGDGEAGAAGGLVGVPFPSPHQPAERGTAEEQGTTTATEGEDDVAAILARVEAELEGHLEPGPHAETAPAGTASPRAAAPAADNPAGRLPNPTSLAEALSQAESAREGREGLANGYGLRHGVQAALEAVMAQARRRA